MKMLKVSAPIMTIVVLFMLMISCGETSGIKKDLSLNNELDSVSYAIGIDIGANLKNQGFEEINGDAMTKGFNDVFTGNENIMSREMANKYVGNYFRNLVKRKADKNLKKAEEFLAENGKKDGIKTTKSGLQYKIVKKGSGPIPNADDKVSVTYKGTLLDGTEFDSADATKPAQFGVNRVIRGWTEALKLMPVGSSWILYIHPDLAYGSNPRQGGPIKANDLLIFEIELLSIEK